MKVTIEGTAFKAIIDGNVKVTVTPTSVKVGVMYANEIWREVTDGELRINNFGAK